MKLEEENAMSLKPELIGPILEATARVVKAACPLLKMAYEGEMVVLA